MTENDTWKTNTEYLGSVNFHNTKAYQGTVVLTLSFTLDKDFNNDDQNIGGFSERYEGNNIKVEAYGYPKP